MNSFVFVRHRLRRARNVGFIDQMNVIYLLKISHKLHIHNSHEYTQDLLEPEANHAVQMLLPDYAKGDLSSLCVWPDQVRHWYKYRWTSPLHFIDTPDQACNFKYQSKPTKSSSLLHSQLIVITSYFDNE